VTKLTNELQWIYPKPFINQVTVDVSATDKLGHTNNVRYVEWLESIAWAHIESLGCGWDIKEKLGKAMAITRTEIDYLCASYIHDELIIGTWVSASDRRVTCSRQFQIIRNADKKTILKAKMDFACISLKTGKMTKMPDIFVNALDHGLELIQ